MTTTGMTDNKVEIEAAEKIEVRRVKAKCPKCGGELKYTGLTFCTYPPQYEHKCSNCGYKTELWNSYPNYITIGADLNHSS